MDNGRIAAYVDMAHKEIKDSLQAKIYRVDLSGNDFMKIIRCEAEKIMAIRGDGREFIPTKEQQGIIDQLFLYATGNKSFKGNLAKGIAFLGPLGTGKTLIMRSFINTLNFFVEPKIAVTTARDAKEVYSGGVYIDDLGKESLEIVNFGNHERPIVSLIAKKYDEGKKIFITSNLSDALIQKHYGASIADRLRAMLNYFVISGKSLRK